MSVMDAVLVKPETTETLARPNYSFLATRRTDAAALVSAFLSGRNERTIAAYRQDLETFREFVGAPTLDDAARLLLSRGNGEANAVALAYKSDLLQRGLQATTINRRLAALRSLVKLASTLGIVPWSLDIKNLKTAPYRDTRGPADGVFARVLSNAEQRQDKKGIRDYALLRLLHDIALRRGEVVGLDVEDVDIEAGTVAVLGKGRTQKQFLSLPEPTKVALSKWLEIRGTEEGALFTNFDRARKGHRLTGSSLYYLVRKFGSAVEIKLRPHGIRHLSISKACKYAVTHGIGLEEILDFSRHADVSTLLIYRDRERNVQGQLASAVAAAV